jgi:hypothetical protein
MTKEQEIDEKPPTSWGVVGTFESAPAIYHACEAVCEAGYTKWDSFTPFPVHGLEKASGMKRSKVPAFTFIGGITGFFTGMLIVWYMNKFDYPLIVGGKPYFQAVFPFPIFYELTILFSAFGTLGGMFLTNLLPQHYFALYETPEFFRTSDDRFMVAIQRQDPLYEREKVEKLLRDLGATDVHEVKA